MKEAMNEVPPSVVNMEIASRKPQNHKQKRFLSEEQSDKITMIPIASGDNLSTFLHPSLMSPESFPVLTAFHQFLEAERAKTKRSTTLLAVFLVLVTTIFAATGAIVMSMIFFRHLKHDYDETRREMVTFVEKTLQTRQESVTAYETIKNDISKLLAEIETAKQQMVTVLSTSTIPLVTYSIPMPEEKSNQITSNMPLKVASKHNDVVDSEKTSMKTISMAKQKAETVVTSSIDKPVLLREPNLSNADVTRNKNFRNYEPLLLTITLQGTTNAVLWYIPSLPGLE